MYVRFFVMNNSIQIAPTQNVMIHNLFIKEDI